MALETARQKNLTDSISETEFKLGETEKKLFHMKRSKTQVTEGNCLLVYVTKLRLKNVSSPLQDLRFSWQDSS
jgi:hypothetical protein